MDVMWIVISCLLWVSSLWFMYRNQLLAPAMSYLGLLALSFAKHNGLPLVPINNTILIAWLCMTLVVMLATLMQPWSIRMQTRGTIYMIIGAITGLAVGLLGYIIVPTLSAMYALMIVGIGVGVFFSYLLFTNTTAGEGVNFRSGNFFRYFLAKGFPIAIATMIPGVVLVILLAIHLANSSQSLL